MAHLYLNSESDAVYLDVTAGDRAAATMVAAADGVHLHLDDTHSVVGVEVLDVSGRVAGDADEPEFGLLHVNPGTDSLYLDVSAGTRSPVDVAPIADGVYVHVDAAGALVAIEVMDITRRGGLHVADLDETPGSPRPEIFAEIERAAASRGDGRSRA